MPFRKFCHVVPCDVRDGGTYHLTPTEHWWKRAVLRPSADATVTHDASLDGAENSVNANECVLGSTLRLDMGVAQPLRIHFTGERDVVEFAPTAAPNLRLAATSSRHVARTDVAVDDHVALPCFVDPATASSKALDDATGARVFRTRFVLEPHFTGTVRIRVEGDDKLVLDVAGGDVDKPNAALMFDHADPTNRRQGWFVADTPAMPSQFDSRHAYAIYPAGCPAECVYASGTGELDVAPLDGDTAHAFAMQVRARDDGGVRGGHDDSSMASAEVTITQHNKSASKVFRAADGAAKCAEDETAPAPLMLEACAARTGAFVVRDVASGDVLAYSATRRKLRFEPAPLEAAAATTAQQFYIVLEPCFNEGDGGIAMPRRLQAEGVALPPPGMDAEAPLTHTYGSCRFADMAERFDQYSLADRIELTQWDGITCPQCADTCSDADPERHIDFIARAQHPASDSRRGSSAPPPRRRRSTLDHAAAPPTQPPHVVPQGTSMDGYELPQADVARDTAAAVQPTADSEDGWKAAAASSGPGCGPGDHTAPYVCLFCERRIGSDEPVLLRCRRCAAAACVECAMMCRRQAHYDWTALEKGRNVMTGATCVWNILVIVLLIVGIVAAVGQPQERSIIVYESCAGPSQYAEGYSALNGYSAPRALTTTTPSPRAAASDPVRADVLFSWAARFGIVAIVADAFRNATVEALAINGTTPTPIVASSDRLFGFTSTEAGVVLTFVPYALVPTSATAATAPGNASAPAAATAAAAAVQRVSPTLTADLAPVSWRRRTNVTLVVQVEMRVGFRAVAHGVCLDEVHQRGFIRSTVCRPYAQDTAVATPFTFVATSAIKNVLMLLVIQNVIAAILRALRRCLMQTGIAALLGTWAVKWAAKKTNPQAVVSVAHLFYASDEAPDPLGCNEDLHASSLDGTEVIVPAIDVATLQLRSVSDEDFVDALHARLTLPEGGVPFGVQLRLGLIVDVDTIPRDFALTEVDVRDIATARVLATCERFASCIGTYGSNVVPPGDVKKLRTAVMASVHDIVDEPPAGALAAVEVALRTLGLPLRYERELRRVITLDLWAMAGRAYSLEIPLARVMSKTMVFIYAAIYLRIRDPATLLECGLQSLAVLVRRAEPAQLEAVAMPPKPSKLLAKPEAHEALGELDTMLDTVLEALSTHTGIDCAIPLPPLDRDAVSHLEYDRRQQRIARRDDQVARRGATAPTTVQHSRIEPEWTFDDVLAYFGVILIAMPTARGCVSKKVQTAHHVAQGGFPSNMLLAAGFVSNLFIVISSVVAAHAVPLRDKRTLLLPAVFRWVNSGVLVTSLTYTQQLLQLPRLYGIAIHRYRVPRLHRAYMVLNFLGFLTALPLAIVGACGMSLMFVLLGMTILLNAAGSLTFIETLLAGSARRSRDVSRVAVRRAFARIAILCVTCALGVTFLVQMPVNVGYEMLLHVFEYGTLPDDWRYYIYLSSGREFLGRRLACTAETVQLGVASIVDLLAVVVLP